MNRRQERFIETFVILMFPVTLLVACTANGNDTNAGQNSNAFNYAEIVHGVGIRKTSALPFGATPMNQDDTGIEDLEWSILKGNDDQYVMVAPSLHLAIFKPATEGAENADMARIVKYNEKPAFAMPEKYTFHFESNGYNIAADDMTSLKQHAEFLLRNPNFTLSVNGHTDRTGARDYNQKLSEQRAQFVADILVTFGAPQSQLIVDGYGETIPVSQDKPEENRRVELEYSQTMMLSAM
ncbi:MAG: OmpA family protein [Gammaproteobacteria bacterium]|nr:OmpA family protein [Gammaproteobacteria bacterium]